MNAAQPDNTLLLVVVVVAALIPLLFVLIVATMFATLFGPWMRGFLGGAPVSIVQLIGMRLRGSPPRLIVDALVTLVHRGHPYQRATGYSAESIYLAQRGMIRSAEHLADLVEKAMKADAAT